MTSNDYFDKRHPLTDPLAAWPSTVPPPDENYIRVSTDTDEDYHILFDY